MDDGLDVVGGVGMVVWVQVMVGPQLVVWAWVKAVLWGYALHVRMGEAGGGACGMVFWLFV